MTECQVCKIKFEAKTSRAIYCSHKCRSKAWCLRNPEQRKNSVRQYNHSTKGRLNRRRYKDSAREAYGYLVQRCENVRRDNYRWYGHKGIGVQLTPEEFTEIFFRTDHCESCGVELQDIDRRKIDGRTVDRIDSNKHYTKRNIRIICKSCNSSEK